MQRKIHCWPLHFDELEHTESTAVLCHPLWLSDTILWLRTMSTLAQVMACYLGMMAPNHHLNQCWRSEDTIQWNKIEICNFKIASRFPWEQWVKPLICNGVVFFLCGNQLICDNFAWSINCVIKIIFGVLKTCKNAISLQMFLASAVSLHLLTSGCTKIALFWF